MTQYVTNYTKTGYNGNLKIDITNYNIQVTDSNNIALTLNSGGTTHVRDISTKPYILLPFDNDNTVKVYSNSINIYWVRFHTASHYIMEWNKLPQNTAFAQENATAVEYTDTSARVYPSSYRNLCVLPTGIPNNLIDQQLEIRIFACDTDGNIISGTTSSDRVVFTPVST